MSNSSTPTFKQVRDLVADLKAETDVEKPKVPKLRAAAKKLQEVMSRSDTRKRLADEAMRSLKRREEGRRPTASLRVERRKGLSSQWRVIVIRVVEAIEAIKGKGKLSAEDVNILLKIIQACDMATEGFENAYCSSKLSQKEVKAVTRLCIRLMEDEAVLKVAEVELLETLAYICSSSEYVAHFRPHQEMRLMMEEADLRILADDDTSVSPGALDAATKIFENLIKTAVKLDISLHLVMPGSIKLVANWCVRVIKTIDTPGTRIQHLSEQSRLLGGVSALIRSNPEQAIAPLRRHGRPMYSFARRRYQNADDRQRHVLNEYLLCHIHVGEVAGKLQGLMRGDLGDLGEASLSFRQVNSLLDLAMENNRKQDKSDLPLTEFQKSCLDLTAKLVACAQRLYIGDAEWNLLGDPTEALTSMLHDANDTEDYLRLSFSSVMQSREACSVSVVAQSPFVSHLLQPLYDSTLATSTGNSTGGHSPMETGYDALPGMNNEDQTLLQELAQFSGPTRPDPAALVSQLQVLSAVAEAFPAGACWISSCQTTAWKRLPAVKEWGTQPLSILVSSPKDLAVVVHVLANVLLRSGGAGGDVEIQRWALLCLINLTHSTAVLSFFHQDDSEALAQLADPWRLVWTVLFRTDQRYMAATKDPSSGLVGELVILLLEGIIRNFCTDPGITLSSPIQLRQNTFVCAKQEGVWNLPVFWNPSVPDSTACFDLIRSMVYGVGLSEGGSDMICQATSNDESSSALGLNMMKRRCKLLSFCLQALGSVTRESTIAGIAVCAANLVHGSCQPQGRELSFSDTMTPQSIVDREYKFVTLTSLGVQSLDFLSWPLDASTRLLWENPPSVDPMSVDLFFIDEVSSESTRATQLILLKALESASSRSSCGADFVAASDSAILLNFALQQQHVVLARRQTISYGEASLHSPFLEDKPPSDSSLPLSLRTLSMKVALHLALYQKSSFTSSHQQKLEKELVELLGLTKTLAESAPQSKDAEIVFTHIWQITHSLVEAFSEDQFGLSTSITEAARPLCSVILDLLHDYRSYGDQELVDDSHHTKLSVLEDDLMADEADDGFYDSDSDSDDVFDETKKKRAAKKKRVAKKRKPREAKRSKSAVSGDKLHQHHAFLLASLLIGMDPSPKVCQQVAEALLGVDDIISCADADIDLAGGLFASKVLCTDSVILQDESSQLEVQAVRSGYASNISLVCTILKALRANEVPDISLHSLCFQCCSTVGESMTSSHDASLVAGILVKRVGLKFRSKLCAIQVCAVTKSFDRCASSESFCKEYPGFVLPFLSDINGTVRRQASISIGAAIQLLPVDKIINSVQKRLPPLSAGLMAEDAREAFRSWLKSKRDLEIPDASEDQVWEDIFTSRSVECGVIDCWATIAGAVTVSNEYRLRILFQLLKVACFRPDRELLLYQVVDQIALSLGFNKAEGIIHSEYNGLLRVWLEAGRISLLDLPLLISAPSLLHLLILNQFPVRSTKKGVQDLDAEALQMTAAKRFLLRKASSIIPLLLLQSVSNLPESSVEEDGGPLLLQNQFMKDMCSLSNEDDDIDIKKVLREQLSGILAVQALMSNGNESQQSTASKMKLLLTSLLPENTVQHMGGHCASASVRQLLELSGKQFNQGQRDFWGDSDACQQSVFFLIEQYGSSHLDGGDVFRRIHSTAAEFFVFANYNLITNPVSSQIQKRYTAVDALCNLIVQQLSVPQHEGLHISFYVRFLSQLLFREDMSAIHPLIVSTTKKLIHETALHCGGKTSILLKNELRLIAKDLLCTCMHVHERCQQAYVSQFLAFKNQQETAERRRLGFVGAHMQGDDRPTLQSAFLFYNERNANEALISTLIGSYDIIKIILENADDIALDSDAFVGASPPYRTSKDYRVLLGQVNSSFVAQDLVETFLNQQVYTSPSLRFLEDVSAGSEEASRLSQIEQRILKAELRELQNILSGDNGHELSPQEVRSVVRALGIYCGNRYDQEVRLAASYCVGEVASQLALMSLDPLPREGAADQLAKSIKKRQGDLFLLSKAIQHLLKCLTVSGTNAALIALDTLKAAVGCKEGREWRKYIEDEEALRLLSSFLGSQSQSQQPSTSSLFLNDNEVKGLCEKAGSICRRQLTGDAWCWDEDLWRSGSLGKVSFEEWICCVVPSILVLSYTTKPELTSDSNCLPLCQRMSCIDPVFASSIFPAVILDLLSEGGDSQHGKSINIDGVLQDTFIGKGDSLINKNITCSFTALFEGLICNAESGDTGKVNDPQAVTLALDTLDCLRRLTQSRFMVSADHTLKKGTKKRSKTIPSPDEEEPPAWRGVPFGAVLRLDGLLVAKACLKASRPASGLFFAEMYADSRFGGSSSTCEKLCLVNAATLCGTSSSADISGFASCHSGAHSKRSKVKEDSSNLQVECLGFLQLLHDCFASLGEDHAGKTVRKNIVDLQFSINQNPSAFLATVNGGQHSFSSLMELDNALSLNGNSKQDQLSTISCLQGLGLRNISQSYIQGLISDHTANFTSSDSKELRDKWFECSLNLMQWSDPIFVPSSDSNETTQHSNPWSVLLSCGAQDLSKLGAHQAGFHEEVVEAMHALSQDDYAFSLVKLNEARNLIVNKLSFLVHPEIPLGGLFDCAGKLQALNQLESLLKGGSCPIKETLKVYCPNAAAITTGAERLPTFVAGSAVGFLPEANSFGECLAELTLRSMCSKAQRDSKEKEASLLLERLIVQLSSKCSIECSLGRGESAIAALGRLRSLHQYSVGKNDILSLLSLRLQEARVLDLQGDFRGAIRQAAQVVSHLNGVTSSTERDALLSEARVVCGHWMGRNKVEPAHSILQGYLEPGAECALSVYETQNNANSSRQATAALLEVGQLASSLFDTVSARVQSTEWKKAGEILGERAKEVESCNELIEEQRKLLERAEAKSKQSKDAKAQLAKLQGYFDYRSKLERQIANARSERDKIESSMEVYRQQSLKATVRALSIAGSSGGDDLSRHVYRMVSLWFSSRGTNQQKAVNSILSDAVESVPSFQFVPLASQLFSMLGQDSQSTSDFNNVLVHLLFKMCHDHPYHGLVHLLYVSNEKRVGTGVDGRNADEYLENTSSSSRAKDSKELIKRLQQEDDFTQSLIESYQALVEAYIALALVPWDAYGPGTKVSFLKIGKSAAQRLDQCLGSGSRRFKVLPCVLTQPPCINPGSDYKGDGFGPVGSELVDGFEKSFEVARGGKSRPKIVNCIGSRGSVFQQLVKGGDELRQDAMMEQVFGYVNKLMLRRTEGGTDEEGSNNNGNPGRSLFQNNLKVVTYTIVPLSPTMGVLEWVKDTKTLLGCIVNSTKTLKSLHQRYYPGEWDHYLSCTEYFKKQEDNKRKAFNDICRFHSPCFRFFFVERFGHSMQAWYSAKIRYARSVAVSSIVGHILGIGDRHGSNILVHEKSSEVVHIDFGIVFEQGKLLSVAEKVPFRLTRNVVDGLGPTGTEGLFTKASEATLKVLKRNASALLTILSAVAADPLYTWNMSPAKARERQRLTEPGEDDDDEEDATRAAASRTSTTAATAFTGKEMRVDQNEAAVQAIGRIKEKLNGYEDGTSGEQQSVEGQVQLLINSARDSDKLAEMFVGWSPWV